MDGSRSFAVLRMTRESEGMTERKSERMTGDPVIEAYKKNTSRCSARPLD